MSLKCPASSWNREALSVSLAALISTENKGASSREQGKEHRIWAGSTSPHRWRLCIWPSLPLPSCPLGPPAGWHVTNLTAAPQTWMHISAPGHRPPWNAIRHLSPSPLLAWSPNLPQMSRAQPDTKQALPNLLLLMASRPQALCITLPAQDKLARGSTRALDLHASEFSSLNDLGRNMAQVLSLYPVV